MLYRSIVVILVMLSLWSCDDPKPNDLLPSRKVDVTIDLSLPSYIDLQVTGGYAYTPVSAGYGLQGMVIICRKTNSYMAYDRACPHLSLNQCKPMVYDGLYLTCSCDSTKFNPLNGGVSTTVNFQARAYHVELLSSNVLKITSY